jgi:hypothetical protein
LGTTKESVSKQGCQMVYFQTKNPNLGKFWRFLPWKILGICYGLLVNFPTFWYIFRPFDIVCGYLVYFTILVYCASKNLAALFRSALHQQRVPAIHPSYAIKCSLNVKKRWID